MEVNSSDNLKSASDTASPASTLLSAVPEQCSTSAEG